MKKNMLKRVLFCVLAACLLSQGLMPARARADVVLELNDSFWRSNREECDYVYRSYTVNGPEGYAVLWESPVSSRQREILTNGTSVYGNWHYTDKKGETWCAVPGEGWSSTGEENVRGWIKTSECLAVPDHISFQEAYGEEFTGYDPAYDGAFDGVDTVVLWTYPGSGVIEADGIDADWFRRSEDYAYVFNTCWRDGQGRLWAFVGYCYGIRNTWICLDDPANGELEMEADILPQDAVVYPPADELPVVHSGVTGYVIGGVLAVIAATVLLLWIFFVRKRRA